MLRNDEPRLLSRHGPTRARADRAVPLPADRRSPPAPGCDRESGDGWCARWPAPARAPGRERGHGPAPPRRGQVQTQLAAIALRQQEYASAGHLALEAFTTVPPRGPGEMAVLRRRRRGKRADSPLARPAPPSLSGPLAFRPTVSLHRLQRSEDSVDAGFNARRIALAPPDDALRVENEHGSAPSSVTWWPTDPRRHIRGDRFVLCS